MDNLTIGDETIFSIQLKTDGHFANATIFCVSEKIGRDDEYTPLNTFSELLKDKLINYDYGLAKKIAKLNKESIYSYVTDGFEKSDSWHDSNRLGSLWLTLNLTPCFDGDIFILLSIDEYDRVIWKKFNSDIISESFLPAGYVLAHLNLLLNSL